MPDRSLIPENQQPPVSLQKRLFAVSKKSVNVLFLSLFKPLNSRVVKVGKVPVAESNTYYRNAMVCPSGMLLETENFLNGNLLRDQLTRRSSSVLQKILEFYGVAGDIAYLMIAADVCRYLARRKKGKVAIPFYLSAYYYGYAFLKKRKENGADTAFSARDFSLIPVIHIVNEAMAGIFRYLKSQKGVRGPHFRLHGVDGRAFVFEAPEFRLSVPAEAVTDLVLCSDFEVSGLSLNNRHPGGGVPLVAKISSQQLSRSLKTPPGLTIPVTMLVQAKMLSDGTMSLRPIFQDTSMAETIHIEDERLLPGEWALARDFTTPFGCFLHAIGQRNLLAAMLKPATHEHTNGLFMVEPYQPGKIPVVFIHGLLSSPETWGEMVNSLKNDPCIRQRYQFWFYAYATGVPVLASARGLRQALLAAKEEFCTTPVATENFEKMVLVGHSMGGLITRLLLQQEPEYMMEHMAGFSKNALLEKLSGEEMKLLEDFILQEPLDFVRRAIFMAVPHRGAAMAQRKLARLGINLTEPTEYLKKVANALWKIGSKLYSDAALKIISRFFSGIGNLDPASPLITALGDSPLKSDVIFHSIIGNKNAAGVPGGSDGVVPYSSSHVDGVASEYIVKSHHSVHQTPAAILEVLRILLFHLQS